MDRRYRELKHTGEKLRSIVRSDGGSNRGDGDVSSRFLWEELLGEATSEVTPEI